MRRLILTTLAALLGVAGTLSPRPAAAFEQEYFEMQRRIAQLEGLVADLQDRQAVRTSYASETTAMDDGGAASGCTSCGGAGCDRCYRSMCSSCQPACGGPYGNVEFGTFIPFATNGDSPTIGTAGAAFATGNAGAALAAGAAAFTGSAAANTPTGIGFFVTPRLTIGRDFANGMGLRTRWFYFDHTNSPATDGAQTITSRLHAMTWDVETYGTLRRGRHSGTASGGYRYAEFAGVSRAFNAATDGTARQGHYGNGFTGSIVGTSVVGRSGNFSVFSGLRGSMLMGDLYASVLNNFTGAFPYQKTQTYSLFSIMELSIGSQFKRPLRNGSTLLIGSSMEAQYWMDGGTLNPWTYVAANPVTAATGGPFNATPGGFLLLGFWNNVGLSY